MSQTVIIKSNKYGINLILDPDIDFNELLTAVIDKFKESEKFFKNAKLAISFEGRILSTEEEIALVEAITEHSSVTVTYVLEQDANKELILRDLLTQKAQQEIYHTGQFYKGTLRLGQTLECETSIVILGDVNSGAKVISKGNIVVLGSLKGHAYAGAGGNSTAFVVALDMDPLQIKIGDHISQSAEKSPLRKEKKKRKATPQTEPQVAIVKDGNIYMEPISKGLLNSI